MKVSEMKISSAQRLVDALLNQIWHGYCEIIPDYMPPNPQPNTKPRVVVRYHRNGRFLFLRYSKGPAQGFFWDCYGDVMQSVELATIALSRAPYPGG